MKNTCNLIVNAQSDLANYISGPVWAWQWVSVSFMAYFSENTGAGTIQIQFSNDQNVGNPNPNTQFTPINWANVPGSTATATAASGVSVCVYPPVNFVAQWYRIVFTRTGGAGTFSVSYNALAP